MKPIRVLHPITRLIVGGAQENTLFTAALLDPERYQVDVICGPQTGSEGSLIEWGRLRDIPIHIFPNLRREVSPAHDLLAVYRMARFMRLRRYHVVHTHSSKAGILGRLAARLAGVPVLVHTVHGWSFHPYMSAPVRSAYIQLERWAASFTHALIAVARMDIEKGLRHEIGRPGQYHLIRSAIPLDEFDPGRWEGSSARQALGLPLDAPVLGNVGRFSPQKNPLAWVRVAGQVARVIPECRFVMVGDGPLRPQVEAALRQEGIAGQTILTGLRKDVPCMLAAMDVFLLTSLWEGLPRTIPQALAMGVPVIANRVDGSAEAVADGATGYLCDPEDLDGLAARCIHLLQDVELRRSMGRRGIEFAREEFDLNQMVAQIAALYEALLADQR